MFPKEIDKMGNILKIIVIIGIIFSIPTIHFARVDLPEPFGPVTIIKSPALIEKEMSFKISL